MASQPHGIPDDAKKGKVAIHAAFEAGNELELKLAVDLGGGTWITIAGADVPVDKVG
jgi:hypothetical protein